MRISKKISMCFAAVGVFLGSAYEAECVKPGNFVNDRGDTITVTSREEVSGTYLEGGSSWQWMATPLPDVQDSYRYEHSCNPTGTCAAEIHPTGIITFAKNTRIADELIVEILSDDGLYKKQDTFHKA